MSFVRRAARSAALSAGFLGLLAVASPGTAAASPAEAPAPVALTSTVTTLTSSDDASLTGFIDRHHGGCYRWHRWGPPCFSRPPFFFFPPPFFPHRFPGRFHPGYHHHW